MTKTAIALAFTLFMINGAHAQTVHDRGLQLGGLLNNWLLQSYTGYNPAAAQAMAQAQAQQQLINARESMRSTVERDLRRELRQRGRSVLHADGYGYTTTCGETQVAWRIDGFWQRFDRDAETGQFAYRNVRGTTGVVVPNDETMVTSFRYEHPDGTVVSGEQPYPTNTTVRGWTKIVGPDGSDVVERRPAK